MNLPQKLRAAERVSWEERQRRGDEQFIFPEELFSCMPRKYPFDQTAPTNRNSARPAAPRRLSIKIFPLFSSRTTELYRSFYRSLDLNTLYLCVFLPSRFTGFPRTGEINCGFLMEQRPALSLRAPRLIKPELIINQRGLWIIFEHPRDSCCNLGNLLRAHSLDVASWQRTEPNRILPNTY